MLDVLALWLTNCIVVFFFSQDAETVYLQAVEEQIDNEGVGMNRGSSRGKDRESTICGVESTPGACAGLACRYSEPLMLSKRGHQFELHSRSRYDSVGGCRGLLQGRRPVLCECYNIAFLYGWRLILIMGWAACTFVHCFLTTVCKVCMPGDIGFHQLRCERAVASNLNCFLPRPTGCIPYTIQPTPIQ